MKRLILSLTLAGSLCFSAEASSLLDGDDDLFNCGSGASLDALSTKTVVATVCTGTLGSDDVIVAKINDAFSLGWYFAVDGSDPPNRDWVTFQHPGSTAYGEWVTPALSTSDNTCYTIGVTHDTTNINNDPVIYINGVSQSLTERDAPSGSFTTDAAETFTIGGRIGSSLSGTGTIEEVCYCNQIATPAQMLLLASNLNLMCHQVCGSNARLYQPLDDKPAGTALNGMTFIDRSGNGNTCTGDDGANNTGLTAAGTIKTNYPIGILN